MGRRSAPRRTTRFHGCGSNSAHSSRISFPGIHPHDPARPPAYGGSASGRRATFNSNSVVWSRRLPITGFQFVNWTEFGTPVSHGPANLQLPTLTADRKPRGELHARRRSARRVDFDTRRVPSGGSRPRGCRRPKRRTADSRRRSARSQAGWVGSRTTSINWVPGVFSGNFLYPKQRWGQALWPWEFSQPSDQLHNGVLHWPKVSQREIATPLAWVPVMAYTEFRRMTKSGRGRSARGAWVSGAYPRACCRSARRRRLRKSDN